MLKRHVLWLMVVFLLISNTLVTLSISIAIVSMVNTRNTTNSSTNAVSENSVHVVCPHTDFFLREYISSANSSGFLSSSTNISQNNAEREGFDWTEAEQNMVLSGFFRLNYLSILAGGVLAQKYGSKLVVGYTQFTISVLCSLIPFAAEYGSEIVSWVRAVQGLLSSIAAPTAVFTIIGNWSPPQERGKFGATFMVGISLGEALGSFLFGYIGEYMHWKYIFHFTSICGIIWSILWYFLIHDSPKQHPTISTLEKEYIESSLKASSHKIKASIPWRHIITSVPFIICVLSVNSAMWAFVMLNTYSPLYLKTIYGMNSNEIGIISSVPFISTIVVALGIAHYSDLFVKKKWLSMTSMRKICTFLGCVVAAFPMIIIAFTKCNLTVAILSMLFVCVVRVFGNFGVVLGVMDLSPKFCGVLEGIIGTLSAVHMFAFSTAVNYFTEIWDIEEMWKVLFLFTALYCMLTNMVYVIFGTSEEQPWNFEKNIHEKHDSDAILKELKTLVQK
ncbi:sodium-dependent phosphate transport protein 3-like isoform X2 [Planococcus citri]|uniref:sodium-dependent phosphate transport protein 3-like isoform X2 n=1 Tax=Planococcus citri TaxID=170843 RepID=UPI0031F7C19B